MFGKRKLKAEIVRLTYRVAELEERLCPCEQHDWKHTGTDWEVSVGVDDMEAIYKYKCKRCGKQMRTWMPYVAKGGDNNAAD